MAFEIQDKTPNWMKIKEKIQEKYPKYWIHHTMDDLYVRKTMFSSNFIVIKVNHTQAFTYATAKYGNQDAIEMAKFLDIRLEVSKCL